MLWEMDLTSIKRKKIQLIELLQIIYLDFSINFHILSVKYAKQWHLQLSVEADGLLIMLLFLYYQNELIKNFSSSVWHDLWINYIFSFRVQPFGSGSAHKVKLTELKTVLTGNTNNASIIQIFNYSSTWETICSPCFKLDWDFYLIFPWHLSGFEISKLIWLQL